MNSIEVPPSTSIDSEKPTKDSTSDNSEPIPDIPGYRLLNRVAQGGMGCVYVAIQERSEKTVAIKVVKQRHEDAYGSDRKKRLVREAHALTKIDHPNIVHPMEVVLVKDAPAMVMEYVEGQPLHRWIREHKPDPTTATLLTKQLTQAIIHAHQRGVVHCDLKPQNVIVSTVDKKPLLKIIDFGLAKLSDEDWSITCSGDVLGTPAYMAPEQTTGAVLKANPMIDVYGLGTILYELLTGHPPFEAPTSAMLLAKVARHSPKQPSKINPSIPVSIENICLKCLEKRPEDRYASASHLVQDLQAFLDNKSISAKSISWYTKCRRSLRENRAISLMLFFCGVIAVCGFASMFALWRETKTKATIAETLLDTELQRQDATQRAEQAEDTVLEELRTSLQETTERLFGSVPEKEDSDWETLDRLATRWSRFADRISDTNKSKLIQAEALMRVGSIYATLGDLVTADEKFQAVLGSVSEVFSSSDEESRRLAIKSETHWQIARSLFDGGKTGESDKAFQDSRSSILKAIELNQGDDGFRLLDARILCDYATMLTRTSRVDEAQQRLLESISSLENLLSPQEENSIPADAILRTEFLKQLCASKIALARVFRMRGELAQAIDLLANTSAGLSFLEKLDPEDPVVLRLRSLQSDTLGFSQLAQGQLDFSRQSFLEATHYQEMLLKQYPRRQDFLKNYANFLGSLAVVSIRLRNPDEALNYIFKSLRIHSELTERFPDRPEYLGEKAKSLSNLVAILAAGNRLDEASIYGAELIDLQTKLCFTYPEQAEYSYGLAASLNIVATVLGRTGQTLQAFDYFDQSQAVYSELIHRNPTVPIYRMGLANACFAKAELSRLSYDWPRAIDAYSQAIEVIYSGMSSSPIAESSLLAKAYLGQAVAYKELGNLPISRACARLGAAAIEPWKDKDSLGQEILRRCLEAAADPVDETAHR